MYYLLTLHERFSQSRNSFHFRLAIDSVILSIYSNPARAAWALQGHLEMVEQLLERWRIIVNKAKFSCYFLAEQTNVSSCRL